MRAWAIFLMRPDKNFPSFSEGLSLRGIDSLLRADLTPFPSFSEGLSLRAQAPLRLQDANLWHNFSARSFIEGASTASTSRHGSAFPFLFGGTFIEGLRITIGLQSIQQLSLPFRRDFH